MYLHCRGTSRIFIFFTGIDIRIADEEDTQGDSTVVDGESKSHEFFELLECSKVI